jgi:hypothetical protein
LFCCGCCCIFPRTAISKILNAFIGCCETGCFYPKSFAPITILSGFSIVLFALSLRAGYGLVLLSFDVLP